MLNHLSGVRAGLAIGIVVGTSLACGGITDEDVRQCTWRSDEVCAQHFEERFEDPTLDSTGREQGRVMVKAACDRGEALACRVWGIEVGFAREGFAPRVDEALGALEIACGSNDTEACFQIARLSSKPGPSQNLARSHDLYTTLCDNGGAGSCNNLGYLVENGEGVKIDLARAATLYQRSCRLGDELACSNEALMLDLGRGVEQDKPRAQALWRKQCSPARAQDCFRLANSLRDTSDDLTEASAITEKACKDGHKPACVTLGFDLSAGRGRTKDETAAVTMWMAACDAQNARGCDAAGVAYDNANGVEKDAAKAELLFEKGCMLGFGSACYNLSIHRPDDEPMLVERACQNRSGRGCNDHGVNELNKGNLANARAAYDRACDLGHRLGCKNLGVNLETREPKNYEASFDAYTRGCKLGEAELCGTAASMLKNKDEARRWYQKGCAMGDRSSCSKL